MPPKGDRGGVKREKQVVGGLKPSDILDVKSMMSYRETRQEIVDECLDTFREVFDEYGAIVEEIQVAELKPRFGNVFAYYDGSNNIAVNLSYLDKAGIDKAYRDCVKIGFHPSNGKKTPMQAVIAHELGHKLTNDIAVKLGKGFFDFDKVATQVVKEARKDTKHKGVVQMASKISKYATVSNAEAIAEAFSDVYCNGKKARSESRAIVNVMNKYLK